MNYETINNSLQGRNKNSRKIANNTYIIREGEVFHVKLHNTNIITVDKDNVYTLNSGGYRTKTTKERINEFSPARVWQERFVWSLRGSLFFDGVKVDKNGNVLNPMPFEKVQKESAKMHKQVREYINGYRKHVAENGLEKPNSGDCWFCYFGILENTEHIREHIKEGYYVPSLLFNAIKELGYTNPAVIWHFCETDPMYWIDRVLTGYFKKIKPKMLFY